MAVWQFNIQLIPAEWAEENNFDVANLYSTDSFDTEIAWSRKQPRYDFKEILSEVLPKSESWHIDLLTWGDSQGHDIQVWYENKTVESMCFRVALNQKTEGVIEGILKAALELNCVFFFPETKTIGASERVVLTAAVYNSNAAKFVKNPRGFLKNLSEIKPPNYLSSADE